MSGVPAPLDREAIFVALFARLQIITSPAVKTFSRKLIDFEEVLPPDQPAIFLVKGAEMLEQPKRGLPGRWKLDAEVYIFCRNDADPNAPPSTQLNQLLTAVEGVLLRQPGESLPANNPSTDFAMADEWWTTLGGLCSHCWVSGPIIVGEGSAGDQAVAIVPVEILVTP